VKNRRKSKCIEHLLMLQLLFSDRNKTRLALDTHSTKCCNSWRD